ncbi:16S rRNA (guanine(527)-N(7))-methyltransferase RsmG [Thermoleophilia bacterium SCSIO 60948]|nr:16S rRNA (guanine(527)-N(7))-methyltransferase RsmG [Thermoleophilia bacterium SCSIO 60948]
MTARAEARRTHIDDSLSGLEIDELRFATRIGDLGSGAGLPGLVVAAALPRTEVDLIESVGRKCEFMRDAIAAMELSNARVVQARAEAWGRLDGEGRERYDVVTVRAVARLATLAELASPLLRDGGVLVAWKGERDASEEAEAVAAATRTAVHPDRSLSVVPFPGARNRRLDVLVKRGPTPDGLPRRDGMAAKRPFGSATVRRRG